MILEFILSHIPDFFWAIAAFVVFVLILLRKGIQPVADAIAARDEKIANEVKASEEAYAKAKLLKEQLDAQLKSAEAKIGEMMAEARRDAESHKVRLVEQGRAEIEAARGRAQRDIDAARQSAIVQLRSQIAEIATSVAEKVLRERLDSGKQEQLVAQAVEAYAKTGGR